MEVDTAFKSRVSPASVRALARHLAAYDSAFPSERFVRQASDGLDALELKARVEHIADALADCLPAPFPRAAALVRGANALVPSESPSLFVFWPLCTFVERHGLEHLDEAFDTMHGLTRLASCELAVRPFLEREPERAFAVLDRWVDDDSHHVRRLVSEGARPRLPWGARLRALQRDPSPSIALLDRLHGDDELYVRRSVANHLNDIAKDHPDLAVEVAARWSSAPAGDRRHVEWVVRHALRSLVKDGHRGALRLQGFGRARVEVESFRLTPRELRFGSALSLHLELRAEGDGEWMIDYAVHHVKANGRLSPKVFKWARRSVKREERVVLDKQHAVRAISTRRYHPGRHRCEVLVNGERVAIEDFELVGVPG